MPLIDAKDKRLLTTLDLDSRASLSQLAKRVGLSKQVVDYRLKRLMKKGIIKSFYSVINFSLLGYSQYKLYLKFQNVDLKKEEEIVRYWREEKGVIWFASSRGRWDLAVSILAHSINEFGVKVDDFLAIHGASVLEKDVLITQESPVFTRGHLLDARKERFTYYGSPEGVILDEPEHLLLRALSDGARLSVIELMEKTGLSRDVITYRLRKLRSRNILVRHRILVDVRSLGFSLYKIMLRLHSFTPETMESLKRFVEEHPYGMQYLKLVGSWDCELEFEVKNEEHLHQILMELRVQFANSLRDYDTLLIRKEHFQNYFPF